MSIYFKIYLALLEETSESSSETSRSFKFIEDFSGVTSNLLVFSMLDRSSSFSHSYFGLDLGLEVGKDF